MKKPALYKRTYKKSNLWAAWQVVRANGRLSTSSDTQKSVRLFDESSLTEVNKIAKKLSSNTFAFDPSIGIPIARKNKKSRPIVLGTIQNRVVQRSILDVIQSQSKLNSLFNHKFSFGGIAEKGVKDAVLTAHNLIKDGKANYFIASDIAGFFTDIKRSEVLTKISSHVEDEKFLKLFENAMKTELSNLAELKLEADLFPIHSTGVAQGCCLSPLIGNIYLNDFDNQLNTSDVFCLRYIDDFIILGPNEKAVKAKYKLALKILSALGLTAYDPDKHKDKASKGLTKNGLDYLGCRITPTSIRPSDKSWSRLKDSINDFFQEALRQTSNATEAYKSKLTFTEVIQMNKRKTEGWIKQYSFCNDNRTISHWNESLRNNFNEFENNYFKLLRSHGLKDRSILLGFEDLELSLESLRKRKNK